MGWAKLDDGFFRSRKARAAGRDGRALFVAGLCWCAGHLTDGLIAASDLGLIAAEAEVRAKPTMRRLVEVGLWHEPGHDCPRCEPCPAGHWLVHDYLLYNPTAEAERAKRLARAEAGRKGGQRSRPPSKPEAKPEAIASAKDEAEPKQNGTPSPYPLDLHPPPTNGGTRPEPAGGGLIDQAVQLAATRYATNQVDQGKGSNADGLARWWIQENAQGARTRAARLLEDHDLTVTQLADALGSANPSWLRAYRRRNDEPIETTDPDAVAASIAAARHAAEHPRSGGAS